jgi:hypothetical protein
LALCAIRIFDLKDEILHVSIALTSLIGVEKSEEYIYKNIIDLYLQF